MTEINVCGLRLKFVEDDKLKRLYLWDESEELWYLMDPHSSR